MAAGPIWRGIRGWRAGVAAVLAALSATPAFGIGWRPIRPFQQPKYETISAVLQLSPTHASASVSHVFVHATVGFDSTRLVVPRGLPVELLLRTPVESATGQPPDIAMCTPASFCKRHGAGRVAAAYSNCHDSGRSTMCEQTVPSPEPIFEPGRFVMTVREFKPTYARIKLRMIFIRGLGA